jgi:hypothetical protein
MLVADLEVLRKFLVGCRYRDHALNIAAAIERLRYLEKREDERQKPASAEGGVVKYSMWAVTTDLLQSRIAELEEAFTLHLNKEHVYEDYLKKAGKAEPDRSGSRVEALVSQMAADYRAGRVPAWVVHLVMEMTTTQSMRPLEKCRMMMERFLKHLGVFDGEEKASGVQGGAVEDRQEGGGKQEVGRGDSGVGEPEVFGRR